MNCKSNDLMRTLLTLLMIVGGLFISPLRAQEQVGVNLLSFSEEVSIEGTAKEALYEKAKYLFENKFNKSPYYLRMNKNSGTLSGGGVEKFKISGISRSAKPLLNYKVIMVVRDNGYSLKVTDFYYKKTVRKSSQSVKKFLFVNPESSKKSQTIHKKLKKEATMIAQNVRDEVRKELYKSASSDIATNEASAENVHW